MKDKKRLKKLRVEGRPSSFKFRCHLNKFQFGNVVSLAQSFGNKIYINPRIKCHYCSKVPSLFRLEGVLYIAIVQVSRVHSYVILCEEHPNDLLGVGVQMFTRENLISRCPNFMTSLLNVKKLKCSQVCGVPYAERQSFKGGNKKGDNSGSAVA